MDSRQAQWQERKLAQGLCISCGKRSLATRNHCEQCAERRAEKQRAYQREEYRRAHPRAKRYITRRRQTA